MWLVNMVILLLWFGIGGGLAHRVFKRDFDQGKSPTRTDRCIGALIVFVFAPIFVGIEISKAIAKN